jgi:hypothetical protein
MKEARIIFAGGNEDLVNRYLRLIASRFGGFTAWRGNGGWVNGDGELVQEDVRIVDVAMDVPLEVEYLHGLAKAWCSTAEQDCVYLRDTKGNVRLVERKY